MRHSKRSKLTVDDINAALRVKNVEVWQQQQKKAIARRQARPLMEDGGY